MNRRYIGIEQMNYIENITIERLKKVIEGEQAGISKKQNWQGGGSFVYMSLTNDSQNFIDEVDKAKNDEELNALLKKAKHSSFLSYRIDPHKFNGFDEFNISQKKEILKEIVDVNTLYVNFTDIDDEDKNIAEIDKKLNEKFYREINK
jgi:adenine-specific DNA-methyltransferase